MFCTILTVAATTTIPWWKSGSCGTGTRSFGTSSCRNATTGSSTIRRAGCGIYPRIFQMFGTAETTEESTTTGYGRRRSTSFRGCGSIRHEYWRWNSSLPLQIDIVVVVSILARRGSNAYALIASYI